MQDYNQNRKGCSLRKYRRKTNEVAKADEA